MSTTPDLDAIIERQSIPDRVAIYMVVQMILQYNSRDGIGLFRGPERYRTLQERLEQAAMAARDLPDLWARTCRLMQWTIGPRAASQAVLKLFLASEAAPVLATLRLRSTAILMIAREIASSEREARAGLARAISAELAAIDADPTHPEEA